MSRLGELPLPSKIVIPGRSIAYSDAGAALTDEDYLSGIKKAPGNIFEHDSLQYPTKEYSIELKPLFSAFGWKSLAQTSLRSFLMCYLLLLEPRSNVEEDDDDFLQDAPEEHHVDLVAPFKKSVVQIIREGSDFVSKAIDIAVTELIAVATPGEVDQVELDRAKQSTKSAILMNLESRMVASEDIGRQILTLGNRKPVEHFLKIVDEISLKDIASIAKKLISSPLTMASHGDIVHVPSYDAVSSKFSSK